MLSCLCLLVEPAHSMLTSVSTAGHSSPDQTKVLNKPLVALMFFSEFVTAKW